MAEVEVHIGDRKVALACDDGQESRLQSLAAEFDRRLAGVRADNGQLGERQALILAALAILDEYDEARTRWASIKPEGLAAEWAAERLDEARRRMESALEQVQRSLN